MLPDVEDLLAWVCVWGGRFKLILFPTPFSAFPNINITLSSELPLYFIYILHLSLLEKEVAIHSSILAWRIPWTEEPGGLQSTESQRIKLTGVTSAYLSWECCRLEGRSMLFVCLGILQTFKHIAFHVINPCWIHAKIMKKWKYEQRACHVWVNIEHSYKYDSNKIYFETKSSFSYIIKSQNFKCLWELQLIM